MGADDAGQIRQSRKTRHWGILKLTFGAILSGPSGQANFVSTRLRAGVVAEFVVPGPAQVVASIPIVVLVTLDSVTVVEQMLLTIRRVGVNFPGVGGIHPALSGHLHYQFLAC